MPTNSRSRQLTPKGLEKIKAQMRSRNCTRARLVEGTGISINTVNNLLKPGPVLVNTLEEFCKYLGITLDDDADLEPVVQQQRPAERSPLTSIAGFPMAECAARIRKAKRVDFLSAWLVNKDSLAQPLVENAMKHSVETRILILDPGSPHVAYRGIDLNAGELNALEDSDKIEEVKERARATVHANITNSLKEISDLAFHQQNGEHLEVRVYDSTPTMTLLIVDGYVCQGFHWRGHPGSSMPHIEYAREQNSLWYDIAKDHFEAVWKSKTTYPYDVIDREIIRDATLLQAPV